MLDGMRNGCGHGRAFPSELVEVSFVSCKRPVEDPNLLVDLATEPFMNSFRTRQVTLHFDSILTETKGLLQRSYQLATKTSQ